MMWGGVHIGMHMLLMVMQLFTIDCLGNPLGPRGSQNSVPPCSCELLKYYNLSKAKKVEQGTRSERYGGTALFSILFLAKSTAGGGGTASFFSLFWKKTQAKTLLFFAPKPLVEQGTWCEAFQKTANKVEQLWFSILGVHRSCCTVEQLSSTDHVACLAPAFRFRGSTAQHVHTHVHHHLHVETNLHLHWHTHLHASLHVHTLQILRMRVHKDFHVHVHSDICLHECKHVHLRVHMDSMSSVCVCSCQTCITLHICCPRGPQSART